MGVFADWTPLGDKIEEGGHSDIYKVRCKMNHST